MSQQQQELALIRQVQSGNKQVYNVLVAKYQHRIKHLVARIVHDSDEQDDVVQESFIKAYRALDNFRGDSAFYTWLYRIAVNTAKNHVLSKSRQLNNDGVDISDENIAAQAANSNDVVDLHSPQAQMENDLVLRTIRDSLEALTPELREAIILREFDGLSYEQIAEVMDCPVGTVRSRIFRAREAIEQSLKQIE